jgi:DNA-binding transcriptional regulator LsrR (DeoR family)
LEKIRDASTEQPTLERGAGRIARNRMRIAWMYYVEGLTQNEIADHLGIGRVTVVRNINEAIKRHEVKIRIEGQIAECVEIEAQLKAAFNLKDAVVVPEPTNAVGITKSIGNAAGMFISDHLKDGMSVGLGWGATLYESLQTLAIKPVENVQVISLLGGIVQARRFNPAEFAWQFARAVGADCYLLQAPAVVDSPATRKALIEGCGLHDVFKRAEKIDIAMLSAGTMAPTSTAFRFSMLSEDDRLALINAGAVGDLLFNFFDINGKIVDHPINQCIMSIPLSQLRDLPLRVLSAGGAEKIETLLGAMKLINCNVLITNEETAKALLVRART